MTPVISVGQTVEFVVTGTNFVLSGWNWLAINSATATINDNGILTGRRAGVTACAISQPHYCASAEVHVQ